VEGVGPNLEALIVLPVAIAAEDAQFPANRQFGLLGILGRDVSQPPDWCRRSRMSAVSLVRSIVAMAPGVATNWPTENLGVSQKP
jgi:hypothetical protein